MPAFFPTHPYSPDTELSPNALCLVHPEATFMFRMSGEALREAGIGDGDWLVVDRALTPGEGHLVVVSEADGELVVRRWHRDEQGRQWLLAAHPQVPARRLREGDEISLWGVVTRSIRAHI